MVPVYRGKVKACVFDWAGTVVDCGVFTPASTFQKLFEDEGVPITSEEVRGPCGVHKRVHIQMILATETVAQRWTAKKGKPSTEQDVERIYKRFVPATLDVLSVNSKMIKGVAQTIDKLRSEYDIKIGSSTGYVTEIMEKLKVLAAAEGYVPDCYVTSDEVPEARPGPSMIYMNMIRMNIWPVEAVVKVDDTTGGIKAGLAAGCWTVGISKTGNYVGMSEEELGKLSKPKLQEKIENASRILYQAGAHFVIETTNDLPAVVDEINKRLSLGIKP